MKFLRLAAYVAALLPLAAAPPPRGSITIDGIAAIKYPAEQAWSPNGKLIAFLWDAAGKQEIIVVRPGDKPVALTDFPVDQTMLQSDISHFEWASDDQVLFAKDGQIWSVAVT